MIIVQQPIPY